MSSERIGGLVFVACMFIGAGIGLIFGRPDVGGAIGMGVGFLLMAFLKGKEVRPVKLTVPKTLPSISLLVVGALFIVAGVVMFINPELLYPYVAGIAAIVIGVLIVIAALTTIEKTPKEHT